MDCNDSETVFATLGMFIIDDFVFLDESGQEIPNEIPPQIGGGGTFAALGARLWLSAQQIGMVVDRGYDFPVDIQQQLERYGPPMWIFRDRADTKTTRGCNKYQGDHRGFEYLTPRIRITPLDFEGTTKSRPKYLHFICSPTRASDILNEAHSIDLNWQPITIYEPIPDRCVPEQLDALVAVLPKIYILSPNAEEALSLLSLPTLPQPATIEMAAARFVELGARSVIIRCGSLGSYVKTSDLMPGTWIKAFWGENDANKIADVTGAGNCFLGGLAAGLFLSNDDLIEGTLYATVSASFAIEQLGIPRITSESDVEHQWNDDSPHRRLLEMRRWYTNR